MGGRHVACPCLGGPEAWHGAGGGGAQAPAPALRLCKKPDQKDGHILTNLHLGEVLFLPHFKLPEDPVSGSWFTFAHVVRGTW